jgi:hypothetical protein
LNLNLIGLGFHLKIAEGNNTPIVFGILLYSGFHEFCAFLNSVIISGIEATDIIKETTCFVIGAVCS